MPKILIPLFLIVSLHTIASPTADTFIISKNHLLYNRDYGLGFKYNHNYMTTNRNNYGIGYYWGSKRWYENLYEVYLCSDMARESQFTFSFTKTNDKIIEDLCFGLNLNLNYRETFNISIAPKIGINWGAIDLTSYCNFLPLDNFRYQNFGFCITFRPQILRNFFRKDESFNNPRLQYEINQRKKARKQGKILIVK